MSAIKIIFIGAIKFSYHCLKTVLENNGHVVGVVTAKDHGENHDYYDMTFWAEEHGIPVHLISNNINELTTVEWIKQKQPDIIFCFGFSQLIGSEILSIPPKGVVGSHPALLPQNRGRHPLIWALALGLEKSGLTFFFMNKEPDAGPILSQRTFYIRPAEDAGSLYEKIIKLAEIQIKEFMPELISGKYKVKRQSPPANYWRRRKKSDGIIDWRMSAEAVVNLVRALTRPYPGAAFYFQNREIIVWQAAIMPDNVSRNIEPGRIINIIDGCPVVKCYDKAVVLKSYQPEIQFSPGDYL